MPQTLRSILESQKKRFDKPRRRLLNDLLEDDVTGGMDPMAATAEVAEDASPDDALKAGFRAAIMAVVDDDTMPAKDKLAKLKELITTHEKLADKPAPSETDLDDDDDEPGDMTESLRSENRRLKNELAVRSLCESMGVASPPPALVKAASLLETEAERRELIATQAGRKTRSGRSVTEGQQTQTKSIEELHALARSGSSTF